jgi:hypothetical protein
LAVIDLLPCGAHPIARDAGNASRSRRHAAAGLSTRRLKARVIVNKDLVLRPYQPLFFGRSAR